MTTIAASAARPSFFATLRQNIAKNRARRATERELNALSDRDLADIGIHRADIHDIVRGQ